MHFHKFLISGSRQTRNPTLGPSALHVLGVWACQLILILASAQENEEANFTAIGIDTYILAVKSYN